MDESTEMFDSSDTKKAKVVFEYELIGGHTNGVNVARFSPNGKYLATGGADQ